jgi:ferredoxin-type protein NapH
LLPFVDPLAALEVFVASGSGTATMIVGICVPLVMTLLFGRFFCGWLCPLGLLLDVVADAGENIRRLLVRRKVRLAQWSPSRRIKYWLLAASIVISAVAAVPVFTLVSPINILVLGMMGLSLTAAVVLGTLCLVELLAPRLFCRSLCPLGALYSIVGRVAPFRVRVRTGGEKLACGHCTMRCPMGIHVMEDHVLAGHGSVTDPECTRCGSCVDACAGQVLRLGFRQHDK